MSVPEKSDEGLERRGDDEEDSPAVVAERVSEDKPVTVGELVENMRGAAEMIASGAKRLVDRGRYRKVRISRNGKPLLPDIPVAAAAALQAASMYGAGIGRVLAVNVGARFLFDVEVVNEADKFLERGRAALLDGDLDTAEESLLTAVRVDDGHAEAFLQLGVLFRLRGRRTDAKRSFEHAIELDEVGGDVARRARALLGQLEGEH
ncbi:MAG: hypothetical protein HYV07_30515 [Deltaproteobacteria bacterium]|nr:hypothetical protein [Deltaproteobacteria bacterium]